MNTQELKCIIVVDEGLPLGLRINTAAVLSLTLGKHNPDILGPEVLEKSGCLHMGITAVPVLILKGDRERIKLLREKCLSRSSPV